MGKPKKESKVSRSAHSNGDPGMESRKLGVVDFGRKQIIQFRDEIKIHMENISALRTKTDEKLEQLVFLELLNIYECTVWLLSN